VSKAWASKAGPAGQVRWAPVRPSVRPVVGALFCQRWWAEVRGQDVMWVGGVVARVMILRNLQVGWCAYFFLRR
jgi:hypothetical protein